MRIFISSLKGLIIFPQCHHPEKSVEIYKRNKTQCINRISDLTKLNGFFYKKPGEGPSSKSFLFCFLIFLYPHKNWFLISIKVASFESFLNCD